MQVIPVFSELINGGEQDARVIDQHVELLLFRNEQLRSSLDGGEIRQVEREVMGNFARSLPQVRNGADRFGVVSRGKICFRVFSEKCLGGEDENCRAIRSRETHH